MLDGNVLVRLDALVNFFFGFLAHVELVHDVPTVAPELAAQDVFVEEIRALGELDGLVDMTQCVLALAVNLAFEIGELLQREDFFLDVLGIFFIDVLGRDGAEELDGLVDFAELRHGEEMREAGARMPVVDALGEEVRGRLHRRVEHEMRELVKGFLCHIVPSIG